MSALDTLTDLDLEKIQQNPPEDPGVVIEEDYCLPICHRADCARWEICFLHDEMNPARGPFIPRLSTSHDFDDDRVEFRCHSRKEGVRCTESMKL